MASSAGGRATFSRMYDYLLGGVHNSEVDREAARQLLRAFPDAVDTARSNRLFLARAVRTLAEAGIRQFLDLGSGIPTQGNVHEVAQAIDPAIRVLYVDIDPTAVVASNQMLSGNPTCHAIEADLTRPHLILDALTDGDPSSVIDLNRPTALLYCSVLQLVPNELIHAVVAPIRDRLVPGSALVISHPGTAVTDGYDESTVSSVTEVYRTRAAADIVLRSDADIAALFGDFALIEPGLVSLDQWRPEGGEPDPYAAKPLPSPMRGAVAIRPV
ncbi:SAM-dependent methyltransferase [Micromonospora sp. WMMD1120]|uniref:SAM-dependent methyltransferase n=1 Tax=Micromonospora sp. WMMD1120 TaxID=3016106 RepID=UPI002415EAB9|nr:SAM-dependent methyltransferase [Micromonospora sp. WMMD1120]MDG4810881.1 SAM-dependent methyltransferase [Micromonospora sp. WMMD1120]